MNSPILTVMATTINVYGTVDALAVREEVKS